MRVFCWLGSVIPCQQLKGVYRIGRCCKSKSIIAENDDGQIIGDFNQKGCFLINAAVEIAPHDQEIANHITQFDQQVEAIFYRALKRGQDNGEIPVCNGAITISRLFSLY